MNRNIVVLLLAVFLAAGVGQAEAYLYNWSATPDVVDSVDPELVGGQDILAAWHATDGAYHYFRMDLREAPASGNFAGLYGFYIDSRAGGMDGSAPNNTYQPKTLSGIDHIVDSHYQPQFGGWFIHDLHEYSETLGDFERSDALLTSQAENGGKTLEWKVAVADLNLGEFTWWATVHDIGAAVVTYDMAAPVTVAAVPVPAAALLFGSGLFGVATLRRKRLC